jgi:calcium-dependent protein kinase
MGCAGSKGDETLEAPQKTEVKREIMGAKTEKNEEIKISSNKFIGKKSGVIWDFYRRGKPLGSGANGQVYEALHLVSNDVRAIKIISKRKLKLAANAIEKFEAEVEILKRLDHPHIMRLYEFYEDERNYYLVTEQLTGGELFDYILERGKLSESQASKIMKQVLSAISYCHANGIVHRDLKPENLLRENKTPDANIKVIDFGESALMNPGEILSSMLGTPYYIAPEVLANSYGEKCDVWSCGVILYILLGGTPPFNGKTDAEIIARVRTGTFEFSGKAWQLVSSQAKDLISKMLVVNPDARISAIEAANHPWIREYNSLVRKDSVKIISGSFDNLKSFASSRKLKQAICVFIASQLISKDEKQRLTEAFQELDTNGDGRLSRQELLDGLLKTMGPEEAETRVNEILASADTDGSGFIEYTEFLAGSLKLDSEQNKQALTVAFNAFDSDASGKISITELRQMLGDDAVSNDQVWIDILMEADANGDGEIDLQEFQQIVSRKL